MIESSCDLDQKELSLRTYKEVVSQGAEMMLPIWRASQGRYGRLTENEELVVQARHRGIDLTSQDRHWLGIAIFQRAYRLLKDEGYPSKILACSMRHGPSFAGKAKFRATLATVDGFSMAMISLEDYIDRRMATIRGGELVTA